jgi:uncharacterized membrane protein YbhN (UPF0104 family)
LGVGEFLDAVRAFGDHLTAVEWQFLALALALSFLKLLFRVIAWRTILRASYPDERVPFWGVCGAYLAGVGINAIAPARGGDLVKLYLVKHRIQGSSYATLAPTLLVETIADFVIASCLILWALSIGALPGHEVYARLPTVDWGFLVRHREITGAVLLFVAAAVLVAFLHFAEHGGDLRERLARGFAVLRQPRRFATGVLVPQLVSWVFRIGGVYYFLRAFGIDANLHNAFLVQVVESLATLFPATPGGAGTKQGLIVFLFEGRGVPNTQLLAFSVGMNIALVAFSVAVGAIAIFALARTFRWKRLRLHAAQTRDESAS